MQRNCLDDKAKRFIYHLSFFPSPLCCGLLDESIYSNMKMCILCLVFGMCNVLMSETPIVFLSLFNFQFCSSILSYSIFWVMKFMLVSIGDRCAIHAELVFPRKLKIHRLWWEAFGLILYGAEFTLTIIYKKMQ